MLKRKPILILLSLLVILSLVSACGGAAPTKAPAKAEPTKAPAKVEPTEAPAKAEPTEAPAKAEPTEEATAAPTEPPPEPTKVEAYECDDAFGCVEVAEGDPIVIASALVVSGPNASLGLDSQYGVEIALEYKGSLLGHPLELQAEDGGCSAEGGQTAATKIASNEDIVAVVGHNCSSSCTPAAPIYDDAGMTLVSPSCTAPSLTAADMHAPSFLRSCHNDSVQGKIAAEFAYNTLGARSAATIHDGSPYAEQLQAVFADSFKELGGEVTAQEAVNVGDTDMRPLLTSIATGSPDVLYYPIFIAEGGFITSQSAEVSGLENTILMGADGMQSPEFIEAAGPAGENMYLTGPDLSFGNEIYDQFLETYKTKYGTDPTAPFHAHAFDATNMILNAIEKVAVESEGVLYIPRQALRDAIYATSGMDGITGTLSCDANGDCADPKISVVQIQSGAFTRVWPEAEEVAAVEEPAAPAGAGGTFIFGRGGDSVQLDPAVVTDGESFRVTGQCLEPLYQYEPGSTKPIPALSTGCTANEDSTEWTCALREGVKFHDGTDFNADAVIFNYERWRFTDNPNHLESQVFEYYEYMWGGFDDASIITSIEKVDDYTVKFVLSDPLAPFLANLAMDMFAISSPAAIEANGQDYGLPSVGCVGTGPFKFVEWVEGDHITLAANEDYWGGRPTVDEVIVRVIPDDSARFLALKAGDIHALEQASSEDVAAADADPDLYVNAKPALNTGYLAFNYKIKEFNDINFRKAVVHAINRQGLVDAFYGPYGEVATNFLPPLVWGHNDSIPGWEYDPDLAKQYLADAGFPDGISEVTIAEDIEDAEGNVVYAAGDKIPLKFYYMPVTRFYYPSPKEIGEAMAADLARAGINVELELAGDWPTYLGLRRTGQLVGLYMLGWGGDNGDPDNFLNYFFGFESDDKVGEPDEWVKQPKAREGWWANTDIARLAYQASIIPDQAKRDEMYQQIEQMLYDDVTRLWVVHNNTPLLFSTKVSGYVPQPVGADYYEGVIIGE